MSTQARSVTLTAAILETFSILATVGTLGTGTPLVPVLVINRCNLDYPDVDGATLWTLPRNFRVGHAELLPP